MLKCLHQKRLMLCLLILRPNILLLHRHIVRRGHPAPASILVTSAACRALPLSGSSVVVFCEGDALGGQLGGQVGWTHVAGEGVLRGRSRGRFSFPVWEGLVWGYIRAMVVLERWCICCLPPWFVSLMRGIDSAVVCFVFVGLIGFYFDLAGS